VVTCLWDAEAEDDFERGIALVFLLLLCVSVTLAVRVILLEVDDATV
jgi:hypothetical protein